MGCDMLIVPVVLALLVVLIFYLDSIPDQDLSEPAKTIEDLTPHR